MSAPELQNTIANASSAEKAITDLEAIMDQLERALAEETARVRAWKASGCGHPQRSQDRTYRLYAVESARIRAAKETIERWIPGASIVCANATTRFRICCKQI